MSYRQPINTEWTTWNNPVTSWTSNVTWTGVYRLDGKILEGRLYGALTGAPTSTALVITLPVGQMPSSVVSGQSISGGGNGFDGSNFRGLWTHVIASTTTFTVHYNTAASTTTAVTQIAPFTWAAGNGITIDFRCQVV